MATPRRRPRAWLMSVLTPDDGWKTITVTDFEDASLLGQHANAVESGEGLSPFRGARVVDANTGKEYQLITDRAALDRLDRQGLLRGPGVRFTYRRRWSGR
jgi:hypothetical protein